MNAGGAVLDRRLTKAQRCVLAVLTCVLQDLVDVVLGDEARARADIARPVGRREPVGVKACLELRIGLQDLADLDRIGGVVLLHDGQHGDRDIALQVRLLVDRELDRAVLDRLRDVAVEVESGEPDLACRPIC